MVKHMKSNPAQELKELRKTVREFLHATLGVPFRMIDCNQDKVDKLWDRLAALSGFHLK